MICRAWYEQGIRSRRYLRDIPYHDLCPEHREQLFKEALRFTRDTDLLPTRRRRGRKRVWVWIEVAKK